MRKNKMPSRKLTIKINRVRDELQASLHERKADIPIGTVEEMWNALKSIVYKVSREKLGTVVRKHEDWFNRNTKKL